MHSGLNSILVMSLLPKMIFPRLDLKLCDTIPDRPHLELKIVVPLHSHQQADAHVRANLHFHMKGEGFNT